MSGTLRISSVNPTPLAETPRSRYCGRFAPSPTGPLHFGSLLCALASYLHAKQHNGKWLVRIEDIDTLRVAQDSNKHIQDTLQAHGLFWDDNIVFQSQRYNIFDDYLHTLQQQHVLYACSCTRSQIKARSGSYNGYCRTLNRPFLGNAIRFIHNTNNTHFVDLFWGQQHITDATATEDPVLKRADGVFAYHLAVVVDDIEQQVNHIVRGIDLLDTTPVHLSLYQALGKPAPEYLHIPILVQNKHEKLSKQHYSPAVDNTQPANNLRMACRYLGMDTLSVANTSQVDTILQWAIDNWQPQLMAKQSELLISVVNGVYSVPKNGLL